MRKFYKKIELPQKLRELNINSDDLVEMAKQVTKRKDNGEEEKIGGLLSLGWEDVYKIYLNAY